MNTPKTYSPVKSADRTLDVLEALAASSARMSLGQLSQALSIPKSSLHGILRTLVERGWVEADSNTRFGLGLAALRVGASYSTSDDLVARSQPILDWLSAESAGEAIHLARLDRDHVIYLAKRESAHALRLFSAIGRRLPAHATALGKCLLAEREDEEVIKLLDWPLTRLTAQTITDQSKLLSELAGIRVQGYAIDTEENAEGITCFAVALRTLSTAQDAISMSIPIFRLTDELRSRYVELLLEAARRIEATGGSMLL